jgi:diguanylate cyclase (GGDEF)-like protein
VDQESADMPDLHLELEEAAAQVGHDVDAAAARAEAAARWADRTGNEPVLQRARLLLADAAGRRGETAKLGIMAREALTWGLEQNDQFVVARAHRLLSTFYEGLGDGGTSLEHAIACVENLPADTSTFFKGDHETRLGSAHLVLESFGPARERFTRLLGWAEEIGDANLRLRSLNNLAFLEYAAGRSDESVRLSREMTEHSRRSGIPLSAAAWDTVARAQMSGGKYAHAEQTLIAALASTRRITEARDIADLHVSIAVCQRMLGRFEDAVRSLDVADAQCADRNLEHARTEVVEERSTLCATIGDYRAAYQLYREFHALKLEQLSAAKDARSRILAAVFETDEAVRARERYREMSERDHLTGLHNRRYAETVVPLMLRSATREAGALSVAIVDLDHFKRINDTRSHQAGDVVLQRFSELLQASCPLGGLTARLGGEEFLLVLTDHEPAAARQVCEDLLSTIRNHDWAPMAGELRVTASIGLATELARHSSFPELLAEADRHLYRAKRAGRDRVVDNQVPEPAAGAQVPLARPRPPGQAQDLSDLR